MGVLALDTRLGVLKKDQTEEAKKILGLVRDIFELMYEVDVQPSMWKYFKTPTFKKLMKVFDDLTDVIMVKIDSAVEKFEKNPSSEGNQSVLEKLLKINKHVAVIMALDMMMAGIDTTDVVMGSLVLQHDETFFTRAKDFLPERWLSARDPDIPSGKDSNPFIFLPFGFGSRSCIGKRLAMMEMEVITARIIRQYETRWNYEDFKILATLINIPANPLRFELKEVDH
uniref:Uncharacterized protein n=1 Tax=Anopheles atroparvus TaxID=41427 RepID=A0A182JJP9_ANOAO